MACAILISHLGIEPRPSVLRGQSLNHWTTRESLSMSNIITYVPWNHVWTKCVQCSIVFNIKSFWMHCVTNGLANVKSLSRVWLFATLWTVAHQAPLSIGFSRQEYWGGLPFPSPDDLLNPGIEPGSPSVQADALTSELPGKTIYIYISI